MKEEVLLVKNVAHRKVEEKEMETVLNDTNSKYAE